MVKTFKEYVSGLSLGGYRLGNLDSFRPIASLGDRPPKGQGNRDSRGVGLVANYSGQAPGTMRPFLTAAKKIQDKNKKDKSKIQEIYTGYKGLHVGDKVRIKGEKAMGVGEIFAIVKPYGARKEPEYEIKWHGSNYVSNKRVERKDIVKEDVNEVSDKLKLKVLARKIKRLKDKAFKRTFTSLKSPLFAGEDTKRIPKKPGQKDKSDKHSDLYTDEDPRGTIHGLGFTDGEKARQSVSKIKKSGRTHAHKIQAAIAMSQRAKVASQRAKDPKKKKDLGQAHKVYQNYIDTNKKSKD